MVNVMGVFDEDDQSRNSHEYNLTHCHHLLRALGNNNSINANSVVTKGMQQYKIHKV